MNTKQKEQEASDAAVAEFLANGGVIQQISRNVSGHVDGQQSYYARPGAGRPKATVVPPPDDTDTE
jgi:hypothetical protein